MAITATSALLREREEHRELKERPTARVCPRYFRPGDERSDRVVEAEHPDLAQNIGCRPGDQKSAKRRRTEQPRDEKSEDAAEVRGQERDRVEEHSAFRSEPVRSAAG